MTNPTKDPIEDSQRMDTIESTKVDEVPEDVPPNSSGSTPVTGRAQEIPALLETEQDTSEESEPDSQSDSASADEPEHTDTEPESETVPEVQDISIEQSAVKSEVLQAASVQYLESPTTPQEFAAIRNTLQDVMGTLQTFQESTEQISSKLDTLTTENSTVSGKINEIALNHELMSVELESLVSGAGSKKVLSKSFLMIASAILFLLVVFQVYMFISLINVEKLQTASGPKLLESFKGLDKKLSDYNASITKAAAPPPAEHTQNQHSSASGPNNHGAPAQHTTAAPTVVPLPEKLNRLRNGVTEKKLVRKETGDWFVYTKKPEECITDAEIIEALNSVYRRLGRPLTTKGPVPSHNSLCILKPDGKGGTEIVMTKDFAP